MIYGLHQAVTSGKIAQSVIDASVARILLMKMHYKILSHDKALALARGTGGSESRVEVTCPCVGFVLAEGGRDGDVRRAMH